MILSEIYQKSVPGFVSPENDQSTPKLSDVRKMRVTLADIHILRMMNDVRKYEEEKRMADIQRQYKAKAAA